MLGRAVECQANPLFYTNDAVDFGERPIPDGESLKPLARDVYIDMNSRLTKQVVCTVT